MTESGDFFLLRDILTADCTVSGQNLDSGFFTGSCLFDSFCDDLLVFVIFGEDMAEGFFNLVVGITAPGAGKDSLTSQGTGRFGRDLNIVMS